MNKVRQVLDYVFYAMCTLGVTFGTILLGLALYDATLNDSPYEIVQARPDLPAFETRDIFTNAKDKESPLIRLHENAYGKKDRFFCSAFVISEKYALTAAHCLVNDSHKLKSNDLYIHVQGTGRTPHAIVAKAVAINIVSDLGLIQGDFKGFNRLRVDPTPEGPFSSPGPFVTCGFPYGDDLLCSPFKPQTNYFNFIAGAGFLYPGMSGGPVVATSNMTVIGVNSSTFVGGVNIAPIIGLFHDANVEVK